VGGSGRWSGARDKASLGLLSRKSGGEKIRDDICFWSSGGEKGGSRVHAVGSVEGEGRGKWLVCHPNDGRRS